MDSHKELLDKILGLKKDKNAVILAHNYQDPEVQDIADFVGDSYGLSVAASKTNARLIVFCGVNFMAEVAAILCPDKKVIMPDPSAGCPLADMIDAQEVRNLRARHPDAVIICYINSTAEVKALSDICCTSANAIQVVNSVPRDKEIIFIPDKYLGTHVASQTGRNLLLVEGYCPIHVRIRAEVITDLKLEHPGAKVLVHPECTPEVTALADAVLSTSGMLKYAQESPAQEFIIGTEIGMLHRLEKENPDKTFFAASLAAVCPNMKKTTLEKIFWSLQDEQAVITVDPAVATAAKTCLDRMLAIH